MIPYCCRLVFLDINNLTDADKAISSLFWSGALRAGPSDQKLPWGKRGSLAELSGVGRTPAFPLPLLKDPKDGQLLELCLAELTTGAAPKCLPGWGGRLKAFTVIRFIVLPLVKNTNNYASSFLCEQSGQPGDMQ